jgi:4'-phosphopantetheinyl transferase
MADQSEFPQVVLMQGIPTIRHWRPVRHPPPLPPEGLHLWRINTGPDGAPLAKLWSLLSPGESERAARLVFDKHRERYVRAHAGLRAILAGYVGIDPRAIELRYADAGRPYLANIRPDLDFNLTTTGDLALLALSSGEPIGVDCEQLRDRRSLIAIAARMFTREEASRIADAPEKEQSEQFHVAWTALEAEVKLDGRGLVGRKQPAVQSSIQIKHCMPAPGFMAAVARKDLPPVENWITLELSAG